MQADPISQGSGDELLIAQRTMASAQAFVQRLGLRPLPLPGELARRESCSGPPLESLAWFYAHPSYGIARLAMITGRDTNATHIANFAFFPAPDMALPTIQAELVILRGKLMVAVLDAMDLHGEGVASALCERLRRHRDAEHLPLVAVRPDWVTGCISEEAVWSRPDTGAAIQPAVSMFESFLADAAGAIQGMPCTMLSPALAAVHSAALRRLRNAFLANEPSRPFLRAMFGAEWAESFMKDFLFPPLDEQ